MTEKEAVAWVFEQHNVELINQDELILAFTALFGHIPTQGERNFGLWLSVWVKACWLRAKWKLEDGEHIN